MWLYEIADLAGMSKADTEKVKAFCSRTQRSSKTGLRPDPAGQAAALRVHRDDEPRDVFEVADRQSGGFGRCARGMWI